MKRLIITLTILATGQFVFSQTGIIKGNIYDNIENEGLAFANVFLIDYNLGASSNINGDFLIDSIPVGTYDLKITYLGYRDTTLTSIKVTQDTIIDLKINYPPTCKYDKKNKSCPVCQMKDKVIPIAYGLPSAGLLKDAKKGKVRIGGCLITGCDPHWYCKRDKIEF